MPRKKGKGPKSRASKAGGPGGPGKIPRDKNVPSAGKIPGDKKPSPPKAPQDKPKPPPQKIPPDKKSPIPQKAPQGKKKPSPGKIPPDKEIPEELQGKEVDEEKQREIIPEKEEAKKEEEPKKEEEKEAEEKEEEPEEAEEAEEVKEPEEGEEEKSPIEEAKEEIEETWNKLKDIKSRLEELKEKGAKYVPDEIKHFWEEKRQKLEEIDGGLLKKLKQAYDDAKNLCKDWEAAGGAVGDAMTAAEESWNTAKEAFEKSKEALETVSGYIQDGTILKKLQETWEMVNEAKDKAVEAEEKGEEAWQKIDEAYDHCRGKEVFTITAPEADAGWGKGSQQHIAWTTREGEEIANVKIELYKGETLQSTLVEETENSGDWGPWTVNDGGGGEGNDYRIKIISTADAEISVFSENFSISQTALTVTSPGADDSWAAGTEHNITWTSTGTIENVKIELWKGESMLSALVAETPNTGEWGPWSVDDSGSGSGEDFRIKIIQTDNPIISAFSENFAISERTITVTGPTAESDWKAGSENHITWEADEEIENVKIELWKGTSQISVLIQETPNNGDWGPWETDIRGESPGTDYRIKVISVENPSCFAFSNNFTISRAPEEAPTEFAIAPNLTNTIVLEGLVPGEPEEEEEEEEIPSGEIKIIEIADVQFRTDSAVPSPLEQPAEEGGRIPALDAIRLAYLYAEQNSEHQLLIAGHTDTTASARFNFELSAYRAKSIHSLMRGDSEEWKEAVSAKNKVEDRQAILKYFHGYEGISSDPGPIDGIEGERTRNATKGFQRGYNRIFNEDIIVDGVWGPQTWGAAFSFYEKLLNDSLGEDRESLEHYRGQLTWYSTRQMCGCGESIPQDHPGADGYRSQSNRRVEILFLSPRAELEFTCCTEDGPFAEEVCDRDTCPLYGLNETQQPANNFTNITEEGLINTTNIKVFLKDVFGKPIADMGYTLRYLGGSREGSTDDRGLLMEENVPEGEVRIELENGLYANFEDDDAGEDVLDTFGGEERPASERVET